MPPDSPTDFGVPRGERAQEWARSPLVESRHTQATTASCSRSPIRRGPFSVQANIMERDTDWPVGSVGERWAEQLRPCIAPRRCRTVICRSRTADQRTRARPGPRLAALHVEHPYEPQRPGEVLVTKEVLVDVPREVVCRTSPQCREERTKPLSGRAFPEADVGGERAFGDFGGRVTVWDPTSRELLLDLELEDGAQSVAFSPDGSLLAAASEDGSILMLEPILWSDDIGMLSEHLGAAAGRNHTKEEWNDLVEFEPHRATCPTGV